MYKQMIHKIEFIVICVKNVTELESISSLL